MPGPHSQSVLCKQVDSFAHMQGGKEGERREYQEGGSVTQKTYQHTKK
jgi:hypothetical protein